MSQSEVYQRPTMSEAQFAAWSARGEEPSSSADVYSTYDHATSQGHSEQNLLPNQGDGNWK